MAETTTWRQVLLAAGLDVGVDRLVEVAAVAIEEQLPFLRDDADLRDAARRSAAANLELMLHLVQDPGVLDDLEPPPAAMAFARELARRHVPVADLGRAYRVAQHVLWQWSVDEIRARIADPATVADAVEELSDAAFRTGDIFSTLVMERYAAERERWMRSGEAVRRAAVAELLAGTRVDVAATSSRLGYELRGQHQAFVVWADEDDASPETLAAAVGGSRALVVALGDGLVAGWAPPGTLVLDPGGPDGVVAAAGGRAATAGPGAVPATASGAATATATARAAGDATARAAGDATARAAGDATARAAGDATARAAATGARRAAGGARVGGPAPGARSVPAAVGSAARGTVPVHEPDALARVAVGSAGSGVAGFRSSHHEAMEARRVARLLAVPTSGPVQHRDVALLALLTHDLVQARRFLAATLGSLAGAEPPARRLAATLRVLLEEQGSPRRAGRRLGVHENTVAKRQAAIDRALPPAERAGPAELLAALTLLEALEG
ncbi:hypothetical protein DSM112329_04432 [Paraconexibacter sp. AEG42_29]|uniref:PucR C-terminal helix-turn-helix domain-containing protein n=1 Tax=Paraconexibacter sp. AEG42_29 TaxID=2997339 RepID=A0AAU7B1F5_9ACTN